MAENGYLDGEGLYQVTSWLRQKDVGEHQEGYYTSELFNDYESNLALGPYNHIEGGKNIIADTTDKYYAYAGNPILNISSDIKLLNLVENSNDYHINNEELNFSLQDINLPQSFIVGSYSINMDIFNYNYIQKNNNWYTIIRDEIDLTLYQDINLMLADIFQEDVNSIKLYTSANVPENPDNLTIYNNTGYYLAKTFPLSIDSVNLLLSINTLEVQDNNYITTIYLNNENNFGYSFTKNDKIGNNLFCIHYDAANVLTIENLTNQEGSFQLINKIYLSHPSAATKENVIYGTDITNVTEYNNQSNLNWEYLNNYTIELIKPEFLTVEFNSLILINATADYSKNEMLFTYTEEIDDTDTVISQKWYLNNNVIDLSQYGITIANAENGDSFTIYLNKEYISDNTILTQSEFYEKNHAAGIETYTFQGDKQKWIKKKSNEKIGNERYSYNHIEGYNNQVKGGYAHAEGMDNIIDSSSLPNHIEGYSNKILGGTFNHVQGHGCTNENGSWNFLGGMSNRNSSNYSFIFGYSNNNNTGHSNMIAGDNNTIENSTCSLINGQGNILRGSWTTIISGLENTVQNDNRSIISGMGNKVGVNSNSYENIVCGERNSVDGEGQIISGQDNEVVGRYNLILSNGLQIPSGGGNIASTVSTSSLSGDYNLLIGTSQKCSGNDNLIGGGSSDITGNYNIAAGTGQKIVGFNNTAFNNWNTIKGNNNFAVGNDNNIEGNLQNLLGNYLVHNQSKSSTIIGEFNQDIKTFFLTSDVIIQDNKIYYLDSKGQNQVIIKSYKPNSPKDYYELNSSGEYIKTTDTKWVEGKKYYNQDGNRIFFTGDVIDEILYEELYHLFIAGNGTSDEKRSNAFELDYQGNLAVAGNIINGEGVLLGSSISNEVLDNIWNEVFV